MIFQLSTDSSTMVDPHYFWIPRVEVVPSSSGKVQLINRDAGCATYGNWNQRDQFWTHWAPLPKFKPEKVSYLGVSQSKPRADILVDSGALQLALNSLKRGTPVQREIAEELEKTICHLHH